jgi:hypothetical protein
MRTREGFPVPLSKGVAGGLGNKRVRANSPIRFSLGRRQRTRFDFRPGGLGKAEALSFHGLPLAKPEGLRQDGRMREGARGGKRVRASILQCVFGAPVSGGGNALRMAVAG